MTTETITWIPVSERLPEPMTVVLAYRPMIANVYEAWRTNADQWESYDGPLSEGMVSHWAKMPRGPHR